MDPVYKDVKGRSTRYCAFKIGQAQDIDILPGIAPSFSKRPIFLIRFLGTTISVQFQLRSPVSAGNTIVFAVPWRFGRLYQQVAGNIEVDSSGIFGSRDQILRGVDARDGLCSAAISTRSKRLFARSSTSRTCAWLRASAVPGVRSVGGGVTGATVTVSAAGASGFGSTRGGSRLGAGLGRGFGGTAGGTSPTGSGIDGSGWGVGSITRGGGAGTSSVGRSAGTFALAAAHAPLANALHTHTASITFFIAGPGIIM